MILGRRDGEQTYTLLHRFSGPTIFTQALAFAPRRAWRRIRYVRLEVPASSAAAGWIAWPEIEVYAARR